MSFSGITYLLCQKDFLERKHKKSYLGTRGKNKQNTSWVGLRSLLRKSHWQKIQACLSSNETTRWGFLSYHSSHLCASYCQFYYQALLKDLSKVVDDISLMLIMKLVSLTNRLANLYLGPSCEISYIWPIANIWFGSLEIKGVPSFCCSDKYAYYYLLDLTSWSYPIYN